MIELLAPSVVRILYRKKLPMQATGYPEVDTLLRELLARIQAVLGAKLGGLYLYGSLTLGDFDLAISDVDLLAVIGATLDAAELGGLERMHQEFAAAHPRWDNRIEVQYATQDYLKTFRSQPGQLAVISPGEPFHVIEAGSAWLVNWYAVQAYGKALYGPAPATYIGPIGTAEFVSAVRAQARAWGEYVTRTAGSRPYQGYAILTLCRALYTCTTGQQGSKQQAAAWATQRLPEWAGLINSALAWRAASRDTTADPAATYPATERFVQFVIAQLEALG